MVSAASLTLTLSI